MAVADATDNQWVNCFQEQAEALLGTSAEELGNMSTNDRDAYDRVFTNATFKRFNLRLSAKAEFYNDEARSQHTIRSATPLDFQEYCKKMIKDLEEAGISLPHGVTREKYL
jgi:replication factor A1